MGCNSSAEVQNNNLAKVRYNVCTKNIKRDIKCNEDIIVENQRVINLLDRQMEKCRSLSTYKKLHKSKINLEQENKEYSARNDVLKQYSETANSPSYLYSSGTFSSRSSGSK